MATIYGIRNGKLTTSKTCNRKAVLAAIEADGFAWGVANADGELEVVNRSEELARKWRDERNEFYVQQGELAVKHGRDYKWTVEGEDLQVVKVYAGKKAAEAACEPTEAPAATEAVPTAADLKVGQIVEITENGERFVILEVRSSDYHAFPVTVFRVRLANGVETWRSWPADMAFENCVITDNPHAESNAFLAEHGERVLREVAAESTALRALKGEVPITYYPDARGSAARFVGYAAAEAALKALPKLPEGWVAACRREGKHWIVFFEHADVDGARYLRG